MQEMGRWEFIYNQINGLNEPDVCAWVRDESSMDGEIGPLIEQLYGARNRLCERLGLDPENDPDIFLLMQGAEELARVCGKLMYHYGHLDQEMGF